MSECNEVKPSKVSKGGLGFVLGLLTGSLIGAATAILTAPRSGVETRELLKEKAFQAKATAATKAEEIKEDVGEWTTTAKGKVAEKMTEASGKVRETVANVLHRQGANGKTVEVSQN